jgi:hypothetical protein
LPDSSRKPTQAGTENNTDDKDEYYDLIIDRKDITGGTKE